MMAGMSVDSDTKKKISDILVGFQTGFETLKTNEAIYKEYNYVVIHRLSGLMCMTSM